MNLKLAIASMALISSFTIVSNAQEIEGLPLQRGLVVTVEKNGFYNDLWFGSLTLDGVLISDIYIDVVCKSEGNDPGLKVFKYRRAAYEKKPFFHNFGRFKFASFERCTQIKELGDLTLKNKGTLTIFLDRDSMKISKVRFNEPVEQKLPDTKSRL